LRKDNVRDYAISAFRYYSAMIRVIENTEKEKITTGKIDKAGTPGVSRIPGDSRMPWISKIPGVPERLDLLAVQNTIELLGKMKHGKSRVEILDLVYFSEPEKPLRRNDISYRVCKASLQFFFSERQVYYFLRDARRAFAESRGLRLG